MGTGKRGVLHRHVYAINGWSNIDWPCPVMIIISRLINYPMMMTGFLLIVILSHLSLHPCGASLVGN